MSDTVPSLDISVPQIVIIADGDTPSAQANARGHLFELFVAKLFEAYGCDPPSAATLNVRNNGYEVDIETRITLSRDRAIAECKAYSSPLPSSALSEFYGKLSTERLYNGDTHGWFVAIPGLTSDGHRLAQRLEAKDPRFRLITADNIYTLVRERKWVEALDVGSSIAISDNALLITKNGFCSLAKQLDLATRLPTQVLVKRTGGVLSAGDLALLSNTDFVGGLPIVDLGISAASSCPVPANEVPTLVTVVGSTGDFEYQFPAAPAFFVGREVIIAQVQKLLSSDTISGRVVVLNAQSGWGKSSLALRLAAQAEAAQGFAVVFDTRTAATPQYVSAALRQAMTRAADNGIFALPPDASFASLGSTLRTLQASTWRPSAGPLVVFFDQFENVFRDTRLTKEFRDLALAIREIRSPVFIGFSWKTDLVGFTEKYPYQLRDEIRGASLIINVEPFGPNEVGTLLARLARAAKTTLSSDLRQRLREYSQGLPWLLKKLASHILKQLQAGTLEETLLSESLNIERLFQQDLAALEAPEIDALRAIAREAPVPVADIVERIDSAVIQSLVDQRLCVRVGERLDVYWDIFREFLLTGKVAVEDTYILRQRPQGTSKVLREVVAAGGDISTGDVARILSTSANVIFNAARELRQLGVLSPRPGSLSLVEQLRSTPISEAQVQERVTRALRRHRVVKLVQDLIVASATSTVSIDALAKELPSVFPALEAKPNTWRVYAVAFATWIDYSGLLQLRGQLLCHSSAESKIRLLGASEQGRRQKTFPQTTPKFALAFLRDRVAGAQDLSSTKSSVQKSLNDLQVLGLLDDAAMITDLMRAELICASASGAVELQVLLRKVPGGDDALKLLEDQPRARPEAVGAILRDAYGLPWVGSTTALAGTKFRSWASASGIRTLPVARKNLRQSQIDFLDSTD